MDVDSPLGLLKRCLSAPSINENNSNMTSTHQSSNEEHSNFNTYSSFNNPIIRNRRFSVSCTPTGAAPLNLRLTPRISQIQQEEYADISNLRELAHEREVHHNMQISQSWEDLRLVTTSESLHQKSSSKVTTPLQVHLPCFNVNCSSPSPTRLGGCSSSSSSGFQSPTRTSRTSYFRRSASPVLRPSPLGVKRKLDDEVVVYNNVIVGSPRAKRLHSFSSFESNNGVATANASSSPLLGSLTLSSTSNVGTSADSMSSSNDSSSNFTNHPTMMDNSSSPGNNNNRMTFSKSDQNMTESPR